MKILVIQRLIQAVRDAAVFNPDIQVAPACILWPDRAHQWESIIPRLQQELPELFVLGDYAPEKRTGPAIWLRCVIGGTLDDIQLPAGQIPIFYLPGVGRQDLRAVQNCPDHLKPLAELQYRGTFWSQMNSRDWTILAFLLSDQGGLGLDVAQDTASKNGMQMALQHLLDEEIELLQGKRLDKDYFNTLLSGDPIRDFLQWLDQDEVFRESRDEHEWRAFVALCRSQLGFDPENEGILTGAEKMAGREGVWQPVWDRFCEAPKRYPNIPSHIRKCTLLALDLFSDAQSHGTWPQWNDSQEQLLRQEYLKLSKYPPHKARELLISLEARHGARRELVWTELGEAPLAGASRYLARLAESTSNSLAAGTAEDIRAGYLHSGWLADDAALKALAGVTDNENLQAVTTAVRSVYESWLDEAARYLQQVVEQDGYPGGTITEQKKDTRKKGECILFVDGLRFDIAKRLIEFLSTQGLQVDEQPRWAALPSVTATGKPAVSPVRGMISGKEANTDFEPSVTETGQPLKGGYHFKRLLTNGGWQVLEKTESGNGQGSAWCEFGDIDHEGHGRGGRLVKYINELLLEIVDRVQSLFDAGWKTIRIVTDHGWLLLPGGLPKSDLPKSLVENKWGRCAVLKSGAVSSEKVFPWYWNKDQGIALAEGISCYRSGEEYAHGGLSLQECLTLELSVSRKITTGESGVVLTDIVWKGLRCKVAVDGDFTGLSLDVRLQAGNKSSSVVMNVKPVNEKGMASVVVEDEDLAGKDAQVVLLDGNGRLVSQARTVIGGVQ